VRVFAFILAVLLLAGSIEPARGWLIALVVVSGLAATRLHHGNLWSFDPAVDARIVAFVLAILLLAGTIDPTRDWLIALMAVTGVAAFAPRLFAIDPFGRDYRRRGRWHRFDWRRWERRMDRHWQRRSDRWGDWRRHLDPSGDEWS
jgi:hypothetical protein